MPHTRYTVMYGSKHRAHSGGCFNCNVCFRLERGGEVEKGEISIILNIN